MKAGENVIEVFHSTLCTEVMEVSMFSLRQSLPHPKTQLIEFELILLERHDNQLIVNKFN